MICFGIQEIGGYTCEVNGILFIYPLLQNAPLYWIKPRLKKYCVNVPDYKEREM
jgi:hypothetical protein